MTSLTLPTKIHLIKHQSLSEILKAQVSTSKTVLFLEEALAHSALLLPVIESMVKQGKLIWIKDIPLNLTPKAILTVLKTIGSFEGDQILAIGDDRVVDLAKSVSVALLLNRKPLNEKALLKAMREALNQDHLARVPLKAVLTTPECASALTGWFSILDETTRTTLLLKHPSLAYDDASIFMDESLVLNPKQVLSSSFKALGQAADAYWSNTSTLSIRQLALNALRRIVTTLPILMKKPDHHEAREQLMVGALMAAFALSNTRLSAATSTGLILNALTTMDPGLASALILPDLLKHNLAVLHNPESLYDAFDINNPEGLGSWIEKTAAGLLSVKLSDVGVQLEDLNRLSEAVFELGMIKNNPVELTQNQLYDFLKRHL